MTTFQDTLKDLSMFYQYVVRLKKIEQNQTHNLELASKSSLFHLAEIHAKHNQEF